MEPPNFPDVFETWLPIQIGVAVAVIYVIRAYFRGGQCNNRTSLKGKVAIITGGSGGIGEEIVRDFALRGATVIIACRNVEKGKTVVESIKKGSRKTKNVTVKAIDLTSFSSVRKFAKSVLKENKSIDILVNNAGVMYCPFEKSEDGYETHWQVNYLSPFLLTHLLLPGIGAARGLIINVTAVAHFASSIDFGDTNREENYVPREAYGQSKLALVLFTNKLHRELVKLRSDAKEQRSGDAACSSTLLQEYCGDVDGDIRVNSVHPGICDTDLFRHSPLGTSKILKFLMFPFVLMMMKSPKDGAQTMIHLATDDGAKEISGEYFADCEKKDSCEMARNEEYQDNLYLMSLEQTGLKTKKE